MQTTNLPDRAPASSPTVFALADIRHVGLEPVRAAAFNSWLSSLGERTERVLWSAELVGQAAATETLTLDDGSYSAWGAPLVAVSTLLGRRHAGSCCAARARLSCSSKRPTLIVRPLVAAVHCAASGQLAQAAPKYATPPPVPAGLLVVVTPAGQRTVPAGRSTLNWSLDNRPAGATGGWTLHITFAPATSCACSSSPAP